MSELNLVNQHTESLIQYVLENSNFQELLEISNQFLKLDTKEINFAIQFCDRVHQLLKHKFTEQDKINQIRNTERELKSKVDKILPKDQTQEHVNLLEKLKYNNNLHSKFPGSLQWNFTTYQKHLGDASLLMLQCAFKIYENSVKNLQNSKSPVIGNNNNQKDGMDVDEHGDEEFLEKFKDTLDRAVSQITLPDKAMALTQLLKEKNFGILCAKTCQSIAQKIREQRERSKKMVCKSVLDLDLISYQLFETGLDSIFQSLQVLETKVKVNSGQLSYRDLKDLAILQQGELLKEFIEFMIPDYLENPDYIIKVGNKLLELKQFNHVVLIADRARIRLQTLQKEQTERTKLSKQIKDLKSDIDSIKKVGGYPSKQLEELEALEKLESVNSVLPSYVFLNNQKYSEYILSIAQLRIKSILEMKEASKGTMDIEKQLEDTLKTIFDPNHIFQLAVLLESKKENDMSLKYGERCQKMIFDLEKQRDVRLPLQNSLDQLLNEEKTLRAAGKTLTKQKQDQMTHLQTQIAALPEWPYHGELHQRHQYDNLNLQVVQVMISCVLENKKKFESSKDKAKKAAINNQVDQLVKMCLEKFQDPVYLLKFALHMKSSNEDKVLVQVVSQIFKRVAEIEKMRLERKSLMVKQQALVDQMKKVTPQQYADLEKQKKSLDEQIESLPQWPHYSLLEKSNQYDATKLEASTVLMISLLDGVSFIDEKMRKKKLFNLKNVGDDEDLHGEKTNLNKSIESSLALCLNNLDNPTSISQFAQEIGKKRESLFLDISKVFHQKLKENHLKAIQFKQSDILIEVLNQELTELTKMKKDIPDEDIQLLETTKNKIKDVSLPFLDQYLESHKLHSSMITQAIKLVYNAKSLLLTRSSQGEISPQELPDLLAKSKEQIQFVFELAKNYLEDPNSYLLILSEILMKKEYSRVLEIGKLAFQKLSDFKSIQDQIKQNQDQKKLLEEEKETFAKQRRRLPSEKVLQYRQVILDERVNQLLPPFITSELNQLQLNFADLIIGAASQERIEFENSLHLMNAEDEIKNIATQRKRFTKNIETTVNFCVSNIKSLETLLKFSQNLFAKKEYLLVLQVGKVVEDILEEKKQIIEQKEELDKEVKQLQQKFLHCQDLEKRKKIEKSIEETQAAFEAVKPTHTYEQIKELTLQITHVMIESANIEDQGEILRNQIILSFKIDTTPEKWDQIRNLSSEEEWEATKNELVVFVMKREENINSKIELLMKDGLFEQCIEIFPHPSLDEDELAKQLNLLLNLYSSVDQYAINLLVKVLPLVQKYAKRCYQEWKPEKLDPLFELVQKRFPTEIKDMFEKATEMLLVNILQSQYPLFLAMLKSFKKRMVVTLGLESIWTKFLDNFKKTHKTKKRLIQMVNFIGDSVWNIEAPNPATVVSNAGGVPTTKKKSSSSQRPSKVVIQSTPITFNPNNNNNNNVIPSAFTFPTSIPTSLPSLPTMTFGSSLPTTAPFSFSFNNNNDKKKKSKDDDDMDDEDEDEDENEDEDKSEKKRARQPAKKMKVPKKVISKSAKKKISDDSDDDEEEDDKKSTKKSKPSKMAVDSSEDEKPKKSPMKKKVESDSDDTDDEPVKKPAKKKQSSLVSIESTEDEDSSDEETPKKKKQTSSLKKSTSKGTKRKIEESIESTEEEDEEDKNQDYEEDDE
ncbi:hypothetical protein DLAC_03778 [Tieghemostelium lacteum]|uniref:Uncharacterized protein n=1 Tax=Tieghemostelium lacteum TaxID=361077 RepID=A0A152A130_TIELA|nr:hypothetical protein DLAC_03778 [Tieghemostelium lacteum]|eukprot:KYQ99826.1 hypothetical protein DLAC_03778 [Tieghemostelium lacteum]